MRSLALFHGKHGKSWWMLCCVINRGTYHVIKGAHHLLEVNTIFSHRSVFWSNVPWAAWSIFTYYYACLNAALTVWDWDKNGLRGEQIDQWKWKEVAPLAALGKGYVWSIPLFTTVYWLTEDTVLAFNELSQLAVFLAPVGVSCVQLRQLVSPKSHKRGSGL